MFALSVLPAEPGDLIELLFACDEDWAHAKGWAWAWLPGTRAGVRGWIFLEICTCPQCGNITLTEWLDVVEDRLPGCHGHDFILNEMCDALLAGIPHPPPDLVDYTIQWCGSAAGGGLLPHRPQEADDAVSGQLQAASSTWEGRPPGPPPGPAPGGASMQPPPAAVDAEGHWGEPMQPADQWSALTEDELEARRSDQRRHGSGGGRSSNQFSPHPQPVPEPQSHNQHGHA